MIADTDGVENTRINRAYGGIIDITDDRADPRDWRKRSDPLLPPRRRTAPAAPITAPLCSIIKSATCATHTCRAFLQCHVLEKRDTHTTCLSHQKARQACPFPVALFAPIVALFSKTVALMDLSMSRFLATIKQTSYVAISPTYRR